jgi:omega-3 fatty acid desaturase (delta-15 desaturase)
LLAEKTSTMVVQEPNLLHVGNGDVLVDDDGKKHNQEQQQQPYFDPSAPPPFKIAEIRAAIPKHCWIKNPWISLCYVLRDLFIVTALIAAANYFNNWIFWPIYWICQGTMFWALFVLGHDW